MNIRNKIGIAAAAACACVLAAPGGVTAFAEQNTTITITLADTASAETAADGNAASTAAGTGTTYFNTGSPSGLKNEKSDNLDEDPVLSGGEVRFLADKATNRQQLSVVFKSSDGKVIVVDGGQGTDSEHLLDTIKEFGGRVDAWLITHPQTDHVGGLYELLKDHRSEFSLGGIYYNFLDQSWYDAVDADEAGMPYVLRGQFDTLDASLLHGNMKAGDSLALSDNLSFRVLNSPVQTDDASYAVNSSGLMYDVCVNGKHFIMLGDMGEEAGDRLLSEGVLNGVTADYVQMSHHGQNGVSEAFYKALNPHNCIWPTVDWLYNADSNTSRGYQTGQTKRWITRIAPEHNYITLGNDVIIR